MPLRIEHAIDLHCHFGPDTIGGTLEAGTGHDFSAVDAAREAAESGHAAIVLKSHSFASPALAANLEEVVPGMRVFGGICTDWPSGGLNVDGVESALALGAKIVWLPTVHSMEDFEKRTLGRTDLRNGPIGVIDEDDRPVPQVEQIFEMVRHKDVILATGHTSAAEHYAIVKAFARQGKVVVTHAGEHLAGPHLTAGQCAELAELGATIELTALACQTVFGMEGKDPAEMAAWIREIGPEHIVLSTDYGWSSVIPRPAPGFREFLEGLWGEGISEADLQRMASARPAELLGLALS